MQPWFSTFAGDYAHEAPFEALVLACNNPCFDENLARNAILYGIGNESADFLFDRAYFIQDFDSVKDEDVRKARLFCPSNTRIQLSLDLGFKGFVAYCQAFSNLEVAREVEIVWHNVAKHFIRSVREIEEKRGISVSELSYYLTLNTNLSFRSLSVCVDASLQERVLNMKREGDNWKTIRMAVGIIEDRDGKETTGSESSMTMGSRLAGSEESVNSQKNFMSLE